MGNYGIRVIPKPTGRHPKKSIHKNSNCSQVVYKISLSAGRTKTLSTSRGKKRLVRFCPLLVRPSKLVFIGVYKLCVQKRTRRTDKKWRMRGGGRQRTHPLRGVRPSARPRSRFDRRIFVSVSGCNQDYFFPRQCFIRRRREGVF